jgi:hypothetical protein
MSNTTTIEYIDNDDNAVEVEFITVGNNTYFVDSDGVIVTNDNEVCTVEVVAN